jgi:hypothetical protein
MGLVMVLIRMNVAITRAKELLVVIGNGTLLQRDPYWKSFLQFTFRNKLSVNSIRLGSFAFDPSDAKKCLFKATLVRSLTSSLMAIIFHGLSELSFVSLVFSTGSHWCELDQSTSM